MMLNEVEDTSSHCGTQLSKETTLPLHLQMSYGEKISDLSNCEGLTDCDVHVFQVQIFRANQTH